MLKLVPLFILLPLVELALLMAVAQRLGTLPTLALVVLTGILGAYLARREGLGVLNRIRADLRAGRLPGPAIVDGVVVLVAGVVLITPGILTDIAGFLCLLPVTRGWIRAALWRAVTRAVHERRAAMHVSYGPGRPPDPPVVDWDTSR